MRAAGRACSPRRLGTIRVSSWLTSGAAAAAGDAVSSAPPGAPSRGRGMPSSSAFTARADCASRSTVSRSAPMDACTAAAITPSTSGAGHSRTCAATSGGSRSSAVSALISALPRSISTSTPSPCCTSSMAAMTRTGSVPIGWSGSSMPPATASGTRPCVICSASSFTPCPSMALCVTTTMPTMGYPRTTSRRAASSSTVEVAPGSWWPMLRSPR